MNQHRRNVQNSLALSQKYLKKTSDVKCGYPKKEKQMICTLRTVNVIVDRRSFVKLYADQSGSVS